MKENVEDQDAADDKFGWTEDDLIYIDEDDEEE